MTTLVSIRKNNKVVLGGDGQVTLGNLILKSNVVKVKKIYSNKIICGLAGTTFEACILFELLEEKLINNNGNLMKSAISLIRDWRADNFIQKLDAMLAVVDENYSLIISGSGDIIKPEDDVIAIGSGGSYARAAAYALLENTNLNAYEIVSKSLNIASKMCIFTNSNFTLEEITSK